MLVRTLYVDYVFFHFQFIHVILIQEEKLEPLRNPTDDPKIRLMNRLFARKRKELKERERLKVPQHCFFIFIITLPYVTFNVVLIL